MTNIADMRPFTWKCYRIMFFSFGVNIAFPNRTISYLNVFSYALPNHPVGQMIFRRLDSRTVFHRYVFSDGFVAKILSKNFCRTLYKYGACILYEFYMSNIDEKDKMDFFWNSWRLWFLCGNEITSYELSSYYFRQNPDCTRYIYMV